MHVFLTGALGIGKSTVIRRVLEDSGCTANGFYTGFGPFRSQPVRDLYLQPVGQLPRWTPERAVAHITPQGAMEIPGRFDALGCACLGGGEQLTILDECGRLERDALAFQRAVLQRLDQPYPVLGVVRDGLPGWTARIAAHPKVQLIRVTADNRDALVPQLLQWLKDRK